MAKAVSGVVLAGGALGAVLWWNAGGWKPVPKSAVAEVRAEPVQEPAKEPVASTLETPAPAMNTPVPTTQAVVAQPSVGATSQPVAPGGIAPGLAGGGPTLGTGLTGPWVPPSTITVASPEALVRGKALKEQGKLVEAREVLNAALLSGALGNMGDAEAAKLLMREINEVLVFSPERIAGDPWVGEVTIRPGDRLTKVANDIDVPYEFILRINGIADARRVRAGQTLKVVKGPMHAVVNKSRFTMDLFFGSPGGTDAVYITSFRVGLGKSDSTPTGLWRVALENKIKNPTYFSPRGEGIIHADDPENPLGEFWIGLTGIEGAAVGKLSYGIHGTIHPETIGKMESMGCIRLTNEEVAQVFTMLFESRSLVRVVE